MNQATNPSSQPNSTNANSNSHSHKPKWETVKGEQVDTTDYCPYCEAETPHWTQSNTMYRKGVLFKHHIYRHCKACDNTRTEREVKS